jgi:hypothetical protein
MLGGIGAQAALAIVERQGAALQERFAARRDNAADATRLREQAGRLTDVEALLKDRRSLLMVLEAFQLESEVNKIPLLRRVLTEDPSATTSYVNRLADPRWKAFAEAFAPSRAVSLSAEQIAAQDTESLRGMELARVAGLDFLQIQALSGEQLAAMDSRWIAAISPEAISGMDGEDVAALTSEQVAALQPAQVRALLIWQVAAIEPADVAALSADQLRALTPAQLTAFTPDQMAALSQEQVAAFSARQAAAFDETQRAALSEAGRAQLDRAPFLPEPEIATARRATLGDPLLVQRVLDGVMINRFEKSMGEANPGMREALYFRRMAGSVTSIPQLMADRALTEVVRGALGLPASFAGLEFEQQRDILARRLDVTKLQDPTEVARMAARYVATREQSATPSNPLLALFGGGGASLTELVGARVSITR